MCKNFRRVLEAIKKRVDEVKEENDRTKRCRHFVTDHRCVALRLPGTLFLLFALLIVKSRLNLF